MRSWSFRFLRVHGSRNPSPSVLDCCVLVPCCVWGIGIVFELGSFCSHYSLRQCPSHACKRYVDKYSHYPLVRGCDEPLSCWTGRCCNKRASTLPQKILFNFNMRLFAIRQISDTLHKDYNVSEADSLMLSQLLTVLVALLGAMCYLRSAKYLAEDRANAGIVEPLTDYQVMNDKEGKPFVKDTIN
eukprot:m.22251 g.22251  ORF g.22251 m.22251 type:complete len:186 (-) comp8819_c0_seq4:179-736(-)